MFNHKLAICAVFIVAFLAGACSFLLLQQSPIKPYQDVRLSSGRFWVMDSNFTPQQFGYLVGSVKHSEWLYWHPNGLLASRELYDHDRLLEGLYFDDSGRKISHITKGDGVSVRFTEFGISSISAYRSAMLSGPSVSYSEDGTIRSVEYFEDNILRGHHVYLGSDNSVEEIIYYRAGLPPIEMRFSENGDVVHSTDGIPPILDGARITGLHWSNGVRHVEYWCEQVDGIWLLKWRFIEDGTE